jgi:hypothetical protein
MSMRDLMQGAVALVLVSVACGERRDPGSPGGDAGPSSVETTAVPCEHPSHPGTRVCCGRPNEQAGANCVPWSLLDKPCTRDGMVGRSKLFDVCCRGLTVVPWSVPVVEPRGDGGDCSLVDEYAFVCVQCGDGRCGPGENRCNCPADCS